MKLALFNLREDERPFVDAWLKEHPGVEGYCTQKIRQNIKLFLFSILNFKVSKFYYF